MANSFDSNFTRKVMRVFLEKFESARVHSKNVDTQLLDGKFAGRKYDHNFLDDLPDNVDPCGENGEFHTLVIDGPIFNKRIEILEGRTINRNGYWFLDIRRYELANN